MLQQHDKEENNNYIGGRGRLVITPYIVVGKKTAERSRRLASPTKMDRFSEYNSKILYGGSGWTGSLILGLFFFLKKKHKIWSSKVKEDKTERDNILYRVTDKN
jgi:hypothetical protein